MQQNQMESAMCEFLFGDQDSALCNLSAKDKQMIQKVFKNESLSAPNEDHHLAQAGSTARMCQSLNTFQGSIKNY